MAGKRIIVTLGEKQDQEIRNAAELLGVDIAEVIRTGAYMYAQLINEGVLKKEFVKKTIEKII